MTTASKRLALHRGKMVTTETLRPCFSYHSFSFFLSLSPIFSSLSPIFITSSFFSSPFLLTLLPCQEATANHLRPPTMYRVTAGVTVGECHSVNRSRAKTGRRKGLLLWVTPVNTLSLSSLWFSTVGEVRVTNAPIVCQTTTDDRHD